MIWRIECVMLEEISRVECLCMFVSDVWHTHW
jgi:hypothetical protein